MHAMPSNEDFRTFIYVLMSVADVFLAIRIMGQWTSRNLFSMEN